MTYAEWGMMQWKARAEAAEAERDVLRKQSALVYDRVDHLLARISDLEAALADLYTALRRSRDGLHSHLQDCDGCSASIHRSNLGNAMTAVRLHLLASNPRETTEEPHE